MLNSMVLQPCETLMPWGARPVVAQEVWLCPPQSGEIGLALDWKSDQALATLPENWQGVLLLDRLKVEVTSGQLSFRAVCVEFLTKLLAFVDANRETTVQASQQRWATLAISDLSVWNERRHCEYWFLSQLLGASPVLDDLLAVLRRRESYWLIRFLLQHSESSYNMRELGKRYGVSYSHFRRLCRTALGGNVKTELRLWRMARSLLEFTDGQESLTQLAMKHGYASSSHFSNETKVLIGVSPNRLSTTINQAMK
jgi:AraC-like DNA-binding protein